MIKTDRVRALKQLDREIVLAFADHGMRESKAAAALHYHPGSVTYHLDKVREVTGLDPRNFYDLIKLVKAIRRGTSA